MPSFLVQVAQIAAEQESLYNVVVADMYFMALIDGDEEMAQLIWREAWEAFNGELLALLLSTEIQLRLAPSL